MSYDVLFITAPANGVSLAEGTNETFVQRIFPPLGIIQLACALKKNFADVCINHIDFNMYDSSLLGDMQYVSEKIRDMLTGNKTIVAIGIMMSASYSFIPVLLESVKKFMPDSIVVCGGAHVTARGAEFLDHHPEVDFVVCGEGEEAFPQLYDAIASGKPVALQGVHTRGERHSTGAGLLERCAFVDDLDIPFELYESFPGLEGYCRQTRNFSLSKGDIDERSFAIMASRGCPVQCSFCAARLVHGRRPRWRSLENIRGEMMWLYEHHQVTKFYLMDDNFVPKDRALSLFDMFYAIPIPKLEIVIQNMSVNHTDFEIIDALIKAGISYLPLAIESGSADMQKKISKNCNLEKANRLVCYAQARGLHVRCFFILGFPGETVAEMEQTIDYARGLGADWSSFNVALPFPGTRMYDEFVALGYIEDAPEAWKGANIRERVFDTVERICACWK